MMNQQPPMQGIANQMAQHGRYGDSMLVHMNPVEVQGIAALSPTGSLTTNPVTGQPEAFLPFLAPLLGSALGSTFLTGMGANALGGLIGTAGLSSGLAGAIGSGLATTAVTGDLEKGLVSGLTGYGIGQALQGGAEAVMGVPEAAEATAELAKTADVAKTAALQADPTLTADALNQLPSVSQAQQATAGLDLAKTTAGKNIGSFAMESPGQFAAGVGKSLIKPANLAAIGVGEGQRGAIEMQERFARDAGRFQDERDAELERARQNMRAAYGQLESDYPGYKIPGYQAGGITSVNTNNYMANLRGLQALAGGGRSSVDDYGDYMGSKPNFGAGTAAQRQANIRGSEVISPEQLQGYRPGFDAEINYFQSPTTPSPAPSPAPSPEPSPEPSPAPEPDPEPPGRQPGEREPIFGFPGKGGTAGGLGNFNYSDFLNSDSGREALTNFFGMYQGSGSATGNTGLSQASGDSANNASTTTTTDDSSTTTSTPSYSYRVDDKGFGNISEARQYAFDTYGDLAKVRAYAEGGETDVTASQGSRIIDLTIAAVMGQLPEEQAEVVINRFVDEFGSEAFTILRRQVLQSGVPGAQTEGKINGNGGGMDDKVPGMIGGQQPVAVSPGEFIVPADVVSGLGDGSTDAGVEELHGMMDKVRKERTGMRQQPRPVDKAKVMPV